MTGPVRDHTLRVPVLLLGATLPVTPQDESHGGAAEPSQQDDTGPTATRTLRTGTRPAAAITLAERGLGLPDLITAPDGERALALLGHSRPCTAPPNPRRAHHADLF